MNPWELGGFLFGAVGVCLTVRQNIWCWPIGAIGVALYTVVFYQSRLYADMGLQAIYFVLSLYGWYEWLHGGKDRAELRVSRTSPLAWAGLLAAGIAASAILGFTLHRTTDAALPFLDSALTSFSLVAQFMMTRKLLENWILWLAVDVIYIGMFISRGLNLTAVLYVVFFVLSMMGFAQWRRSITKEVAE
jgi:nicotinamide mononucleotide transporter